VWKTRGIVVSQNTFYQNISLLRKSLVKAGLSQDIIVTVRQRGFVLAADSYCFIFRTDENNRKRHRSLSISSPVVERNVLHNLASQEDEQKNFSSHKVTELKLPRWILPLLLAMTAANIISLFL
jgi:DNA-binding winged helix-turn-helix (wHTH) protein